MFFKGWGMETRSRHAEFLITVLSVCMGISGCVGLGNDELPLSGPNVGNVSTTRMLGNATQSKTMYPPNQGMIPQDGSVQPAAFSSANARPAPPTGSAPLQSLEGQGDPPLRQTGPG